MPGKKKGTKMALGEFTGGQMGADYIPTTTNELESVKQELESERAERQAKRDAKSGTMAGQSGYYGASGAAGAAIDWRGGGSKQPDAPAASSGGGGGKFGKAGTMDWGARGSEQASGREGKAFGGSGFQEKKNFLGGDFSRDGAFGSSQASGKQEGGQQKRGYDPLGNRDGKPAKSVVAWGRDEMGSSEATSQRKSGWGGERSNREIAPIGRDAMGTAEAEVRSPVKQPKRAGGGNVIQFSRDAMGGQPPAKDDEEKKAWGGSSRSAWGGSGGASGLREKYEKKKEAEEEEEKAKKERIAAKLAALPEEKKEKLGEKDSPGGWRSAPRRQPKGKSWAEDPADSDVIKCTVLKEVGGSLGIVCQNRSLRIQEIKGACATAGLTKYVSSHRLTHVNNEPVADMKAVRDIAKDLAKVVLTLDPSLHPVEEQAREEEEREQEEEAQSPHDDDVEPAENFYDTHPEQEEEEEEEMEEEDMEDEVFTEGDRVCLTDAGCSHIDQDDAWGQVPLKRGQVGTVIGFDEEEECPIVRGPAGGEGCGLHPVLLRHATPEEVIAADKEAEEERIRKQLLATEVRTAAAAQAQAMCKSLLNPLAEVFVPKARARPVMAAPGILPGGVERRVDVNGDLLTEEQFLTRYGRKEWWDRAATQVAQAERRLCPHSGKWMTEREFLSTYGTPQVWERSRRLA